MTLREKVAKDLYENHTDSILKPWERRSKLIKEYWLTDADRILALVADEVRGLKNAKGCDGKKGKHECCGKCYAAYYYNKGKADVLALLEGGRHE